MSQIFIPKKIKIGFQKREGCYQGRLAYVIPLGVDGKWRKEPSWNSWRDDKIEPIELDNEPQDSFVINKDVQRYNWSHFSSNRSYIRVYDPRGGGIEFEITPENLTGIITVSNVIKRGLEGSFIYAWDKKDLVLLPCVSEEYQKAVNFTSLQHKNISVKDLVPGCSYKTKRDGDRIYVGRFLWYAASLYGRKGPKPRVGKKYHIFTNGGLDYDKNPHFEFKTNLEFLACKNGDDIVSNYAEIIENFQNNIHSAKIVDYKVIPAVFSGQKVKDRYDREELERSTFYAIKGDEIIEYHIQEKTEWVNNNTFQRDSVSQQKFLGYTIIEYMKFNKAMELLAERNYRSDYTGFWGRRVTETIYSLDQLQKFEWGDLELTLDNGKKIVVNKKGLYSVLT